PARGGGPSNHLVLIVDRPPHGSRGRPRTPERAKVGRSAVTIDESVSLLVRTRTCEIRSDDVPMTIDCLRFTFRRAEYGGQGRIEIECGPAGVQKRMEGAIDIQPPNRLTRLIESLGDRFSGNACVQIDASGSWRMDKGMIPSRVAKLRDTQDLT